MNLLGFLSFDIYNDLFYCYIVKSSDLIDSSLRYARDTVRNLAPYGSQWYTRMTGYRIPSTGREADIYRILLFPDCRNTREMVDNVLEHRTLDLGSGTTHFSPYSLINCVARKQQERDDDQRAMIGIDARIGHPVGSPDGFSQENLRMEKMRVIANHCLRKILGDQIHTDIPATHGYMQQADARKLPFKDGEFQQILSCHFLPCWLNGDDLDQSFLEADRVLAAGGTMRLFPANFYKLWSRDRICSLLEGPQSTYTHDQVRLPGLWQSLLMSNSHTLILRKKEK